MYWDAHCGRRGPQNGHSDVNLRPRGELLGALNSNRSDLSIDNHVREQPKNPFPSEICNPGARGLGPQHPRLPGPGPGQMGGAPFSHLLVLNGKQRSHFIKLPFGRCLVPACNDQGVVGKISDGTTEINTFWTQRAPQEWSNGAIERPFAMKTRYFS